MNEVLPSIRKTGSYSIIPGFQVPKTRAEALRLAADESERADRLEQENRELLEERKILEENSEEKDQTIEFLKDDLELIEAKNQEMEPKANFYDIAVKDA